MRWFSPAHSTTTCSIPTIAVAGPAVVNREEHRNVIPLRAPPPEYAVRRCAGNHYSKRDVDEVCQAGCVIVSNVSRAKARASMACVRWTDGNCRRNSSSVSPASR